jgi:uncharacterized RDD family membrane protein YckC
VSCSFALAAGAIVDVRRFGVVEGDIAFIVLIFCIALLVFALPSARLASLRRIYLRRLLDAEGVAEEEDRYADSLAGWRRRVGAHLIDSVAVGAIGLAMVGALWSIVGLGEIQVLIFIFAVPALAWGLYAGFALSRRGRHKGQTLGKQILGIRVICPAGPRPGPARFVFREALLKGFLFGPASLGLLLVPAWVNFLFPVAHHRKCALHDLIADTIVVREARAPAAAPAPPAH